MSSSFPYHLFQLHSSQLINQSYQFRKFIEEKGVIRLFKRKQVLYEEGTACQGIHFVKSGLVKKSKLIHQREHVLFIGTKGDLLGYHALIGNHQHYESVLALETTQTMFVSNEQFMECMKKDISIHKLLTQTVCQDFQVSINFLIYHNQWNAKQRLAFYLLLLERKFQNEAQAETAITLTRSDLSSMIGVATESLVRLLQEFKALNVIEIDGRIIWIKNKDYLLEQLFKLTHP
ncbi:MAG: Crp/Fnr family transcriptional regulator [Cytophagaceae bacterium]|jgi:CRP-like cAMP-binding protein|nr:Crp/Fnr family transcriptional regulator [Cytophagaceae bacterium]